MLERLFRLRENGTTVRTELVARMTTFLTMSYIIFVQPAVLSGVMFDKPTGMDFGAITTATCLAAALASAIMGLYERYPIAQAPGMGENFFFVFSAIPAAAAAGAAVPWSSSWLGKIADCTIANFILKIPDTTIDFPSGWFCYLCNLTTTELLINPEHPNVTINAPHGNSLNLNELALIIHNGSKSWFLQRLSFPVASILADNPTISWNLNRQSAIVTLGGNRTFSEPINQRAGLTYTLIVKQDGTGNRQLTFPNVFKFPATPPALSSSPNSVTIFSFVSDGTNLYGYKVYP